MLVRVCVLVHAHSYTQALSWYLDSPQTLLYYRFTDKDVLSFFQRDWFNCQVTGLLPN